MSFFILKCRFSIRLVFSEWKKLLPTSEVYWLPLFDVSWYVLLIYFIYTTNTKKLSPPSKRQKIEKDDSESDEDEHIKSVEEKLKLLKKFKKDHVKEDERKESPEKIPEQSNIRKNSNEMKFSEKKEGIPAPETKWDQYDKLVICTRKGVCARSKV